MRLTEELLDIAQARLREPAFVEVRRWMTAHGWNSDSSHRLVQSVNELPETQRSIADLKANLERESPELAVDFQLERFLLLNSTSRVAGDITGLPVSQSVKSLYREEFAFFARGEPKTLSMFQVGEYRFSEMCKVVSLRRFPAGQMHWEISGIVRSSFLRMPPLQLPKVLHFVARRLGGLRPCFSGRLNGRRKGRLLLLEKAQALSYYRMAKSMELQPEILGYVATSWLHSPATHQVSPHLAWYNSFFLQNGGLVVDAGPEQGNGGFLLGSPGRSEAIEKGLFQPRRAMVIWPRREMIGWAANHPELEDHGASLATTPLHTPLKEFETHSVLQTHGPERNN